MSDPRMLSTARVLRARSRARIGLLGSAAATVTVAVATVGALLASLVLAVDRAGDAAPPGVPVDEVAAQVEAGVVALVSAAPALVLLVLILAVTATAQLGRLLAAAREDESATARARGLSSGQATAADAFEAGAIALASALVGLALAALVTGVVNGTVADAAHAVLAVWWAVPVTAVVLGITLVVAARRRSDTRARAARVTTMAAVAVVALAAVFAVWQLPRARPGRFDPIVAIAPSAVLMAGALLALAAFAALATAWAATAAARHGVAPAYPARQVARRLPVSAVAVLLVALTVAQAVFAATYGATWTSMATDSAAVRAGADLRVDLQPASADPGTIADAAAVPGVDAAAPALVMSIEVGSTTGRLVAVPGAAIAAVVSPAGGAVDREGLAQAIVPTEGTVAPALIPLGEGATGLRVTASAESARAGAAEEVRLSATIVDATGTPATLRLDAAPLDAVAGEGAGEGAGLSIVGEAALPDGTAPWSVLALHAAVPATFASADVLVELRAAEAVGGGPLAVEGRVALTDGEREQVLWLADGADVEAAPMPVRAAIGAALAERLGLSVGDVFEFRYAGTGRRGEIEVSDVIDAIPGASTGLAVFAPLETMTVSMLQRGTSIVSPTSVWVAGDPDAGTALSAAFDDRPVATSSPGVTAGIVGALVGGWWIAAAGSIVLSLVAAFAIVQTLALARRPELGVLRALGVRQSGQARMRAAELAGVLGVALVLGAAAGLLVAGLTVPALVSAVTPDILPLGTGPAIAWPALLVAVAALTAGLAGIVAAAAAGVRTAAAGATVGEEAR